MNRHFPHRVQLREITRRFGAVRANDRLDLKVARGTIHAVIGENGAGKSTAMGILYGLLQPDSGEILIDGERCVWSSPRDAIARGIGMVHQHFMLAGALTVLDNIILGAEPSRRMFLDRDLARTRLDALCAEHEMHVDLDAVVDQLPVGVQQRVEILKVLFRNASILILDEPTAVLSQSESAGLFRQVTWLRDHGKTIILVTHKLNEVLAHADSVTVLRRGKAVGTFDVKDATAKQLAHLMVGQEVSLSSEVQPGTRGVPVLTISKLSLTRIRNRRRAVTDLDLRVCAGEIVGIAGVEGNGQAELLDVLLQRSRAGVVGGLTILGQDAFGLNLAQLRRLGMAVIPADRLRDAVLPSFSLTENFLLGRHRARAFCRRGVLKWTQARDATQKAINAFDVRSSGPGAAAAQLSGGNQQKLILARELFGHPRLLIAAQPSRGVDVHAIQLIHKGIVAARNAGAGVLLVSSDLDEILKLSDRIVVMFAGQFVKRYDRGQVDERELVVRMGGAI